MAKKWAYYQDIDEQKCAWVRELIRAKVITDGEVDCRDIKLVTADDVRGFRRAHFFAGIGIWDYALNLAGWPDDLEVWTGSCPCPSFSAAGKGGGFDDPRHLWPEWYRLIRECRPRTVFGEQVDAAIRYGWLDIVSGNMEAEKYAFAAAVLGAHSAGGPHIRQRLYFCADTEHAGHDRPRGLETVTHCDEPHVRVPNGDCAAGQPSDTPILRHVGRRAGETGDGFAPTERIAGQQEPQRLCDAGGTSNPSEARCNDSREHGSGSSLLPARSKQRGGTGGESFSGSDTLHPERWPISEPGEDGRDRADSGRAQTHGDLGARGEIRERMHADQHRTERQGRAQFIPDGGCEIGGGDNPERTRLEGLPGNERIGRGPGWLDPESARSASAAGAARGHWADCDWWYGRDGKFRPIGTGISPLVSGAVKRSLLALADGAAASVGLVRFQGGAEFEGAEAAEPETAEARVFRLRGYGDGIVAPVAAEFIKAYIESRG